LELAKRLVGEAGVAAIALHPRSAAVHHKGSPDYALATRLVSELEAPVILSGGLREREHILSAFEQTGASAVMLARGALGNPWLFCSLLGDQAALPSREQVVGELRWTIAAAVDHLGRERATRWMRKAYPWYVVRLALDRHAEKTLQELLQRSQTLNEVDELLQGALDGEARAGVTAAA
jgi:tRNA-dihydrouridine synthase